MIYTAKVADMAMRSYWKCAQKADGSWYVSSSPTTDTKNVTFPAALPEGATVVSSRVTAEFGSPNSGTAVLTINGVTPDENGSVVIDGNVARFTFRANGKVYEDTKQHYGVLMVRNIVLTVEYTEGEVPEAPRPDRIVGKSRLPRLLDASMGEKGRLHPTSLSITLNLAPLSLAEMQIPNTDMQIGPRDFVELFTPTGSAGIFRVYAIDENTGMSRTVYLKHGLTTLADAMQPGKGKMEGSMRTLLTSLLANQANPVRWEIGTVDVPDDQDLTWEYNDSNVLKSLIDVMKELPAYRLGYDQSSLPWLLHVKKMDDTPTCEGRLRRNLKALMITRDDTDMVTRLYIPGVDDPLDADTVGTWGVIARKLDIDKNLDKEDKLSEANRMLEQKKNPLISIQVSAFALAAATGEPLDDFVVGRMCRLALPDLDMTVNERIVSVKYNDIVQDPENVDLELKNKAESTESDIAGLIVDTKVVRKSVEDSFEYIYNFGEDFHDFKVSAEGIFSDVKTLQGDYNSFKVTAEGVFAEVTNLKGDYNDFKVTAEGVFADVKDLQGNFNDFKVTAEGVFADVKNLQGDYNNFKVTAEGVFAEVGNLKGDYNDFKVTAEGVFAKVTTLEGNFNDFKVTAEGVFAKVGNIEGDLNDFKVTAEGVFSDVSNLKGDVHNFQVTAEGLTSRINDAEGNISTLKTTSTSFETRIESAEGDIASITAQVTEQGTQISAKADLILLEGYVKAEDFESKTLKVFEDARIQSLDLEDLSCTSGAVRSLRSETATIGGSTCAPHTLTIGKETCTFFAPADATFDWSDIQEVQDALDAAKTEGASEVTVTAASAVPNSYLSAIKYMQGTVTVALSNGKSFDRSITLNAEEAYNAGYTAGKAYVIDNMKLSYSTRVSSRDEASLSISIVTTPSASLDGSTIKTGGSSTKTYYI